MSLGHITIYSTSATIVIFFFCEFCICSLLFNYSVCKFECTLLTNSCDYLHLKLRMIKQCLYQIEIRNMVTFEMKKDQNKHETLEYVMPIHGTSKAFAGGKGFRELCRLLAAKQTAKKNGEICPSYCHKLCNFADNNLFPLPLLPICRQQRQANLPIAGSKGNYRQNAMYSYAQNKIEFKIVVKYIR